MKYLPKFNLAKFKDLCFYFMNNIKFVTSIFMNNFIIFLKHRFCLYPFSIFFYVHLDTNFVLLTIKHNFRVWPLTRDDYLRFLVCVNVW